MSDLRIDYTRSNMERRMRLLEMAGGDLGRAMELECWVQTGFSFQQKTEAALLGVEPDARSEPSPPADIGIPTSVNSVPSSGPVEAASVIGEGEQSGTDTPVAMDADGCGTGARQPESAASLAGEAVAPAPTAPEPPPQSVPEFGVGPDTDDLAIPPFLKRPASAIRTREKP